MRRIERLINLIAALLETERPLTAEEIRARVAGYEGDGQEAFRRMFERDKADLRNLGIPLELRKLHPLDEVEGYLIPKESYYLPEIDLEADELAALHLAAQSVTGSDAGAGILKLAVGQQEAAPAALPVMWSPELAAEQPALTALYTAVVERRRCTFTYSQQDGETRSRTIDPYALAHRRGHWYVVGSDLDRNAVRTFRVSRVEGRVTLLDEHFDPPEDFDVETYLGGASWEIGSEPTRVQLRFDGSMRWWVEQNLPAAPPVEGPEGSLDVTLEVGNLDALAGWIIGFAGAVVILEPEPAKQTLLRHLTESA